MQEADKYLLKIGENIRLKRKEKGYSQQELADNMNVAASTVHRIEKGMFNTTILTLKAIAENLEVDIAELLK